MLRIENWKVKLVYAGIGSLFGCLFTILGMLALPVTAQDNKFSRSYIQCSELRVVNEAGETRVILGKDENGGVVRIYGNNGQSESSLSITEHGGAITALGKDGKSKALLGVDKEGGFVHVTGRSKGDAFMGLNRWGNGYIATKNKDGYRQ